MFVDEHISVDKTFIGGIYITLDELSLIIESINDAWNEIGTEWDFHYVKDKKIKRNGETVAEIFLKSLRSHLGREHTLIVVHPTADALKKYNEEFYPAVIFNLYSFPVFLTRSDYALIDKNSQVTVMKDITEKMNYPKIFYDIDMLINSMSVDIKNRILRVLRNIMRVSRGIAIRSLDRAFNLKKEDAIKRVMKWGLYCADYVVSSADGRKVDIYGREIE